MKYRTRMLFVGFSLALSACATPYKDPRSPEAQKNQLTSSLNELVGDYDVVDSRNDDRRGVTEVSVSNVDNMMLVKLKGGESDMWLDADSCTGHYKDAEWAGNKDVVVLCFSESTSVGVYVFRKLTDGTIVTSGAMLAGFKPMTVASGGHLLFLSTARSGRPHYYVLKRK